MLNERLDALVRLVSRPGEEPLQPLDGGLAIRREVARPVQDVEIVRRNAGKLRVEIEDEAAAEVASRSRGWSAT